MPRIDPPGLQLRETPPPNPLPATERGSKPSSMTSSPPLPSGEGVGGRGFAQALSVGSLLAGAEPFAACRRPAPPDPAPPPRAGDALRDPSPAESWHRPEPARP